MSKLRVLVLVRDGHVPPQSLDGVSEAEMNPWKAEFDVCETLRRLGHQVLPLGSTMIWHRFEKRCEIFNPISRS